MQFRSLLSVLILFISFSSYAQVVLEVDPSATDSKITKVHSSHIAMYNDSIRSNKKLVLVLPGTGASPRDLMALQRSLSEMGFHVIGLDYKNEVITTACTKSEDPKCFDQFRQEIVFGTSISDKTEVDSANSIYNRFYQLLSYLRKTDPDGGWGEFISGTKIKWNKVIATGHSQGAGHAGYLAQEFKLARAVMLSGPQDYFSTFDAPAEWLSRKGKTPASRLFALLHKEDPFNCSWQVAGNAKLMSLAVDDTVAITPDTRIFKGHILVTDLKTNNTHGASVQPVFLNTWKYLFLGENKQ